MVVFRHLGLALLTASLVAASAEDIVLQIPELVAAGSPFNIHVDFANASWPNPECQGPGDCDWSYFRTYLMADSTHYTKTDRSGDGEVTVWRTYCMEARYCVLPIVSRTYCCFIGYLSGCVSTDVTSFNATIPQDVFPNGYPYTLDHALFNVNANGSESLFSPTFSGFSATTFNISDSTGNWTEFVYNKGNYGIEDYLFDTPCDKLPCLEECQTKYIAPYVPYVRKMGDELDACVAACLEGTEPRKHCIAENVTLADGEAAASSTTWTAPLDPTAAATTGAPPPSNTPNWAARAVMPWLSSVLLAFSAAMIVYIG